MGCSSSTPVHPGIYNELLKTKKLANGEIKEKTPVEEIKSKNMKGDYSQFQLAKHNREKHQKERQFKLFIAADEMSGKVMEDREMLSLGTRSRGTSRNTSRATSPTGNKRGHQNDHMIPMTPVAEDKLSRGASLKSMENGNIQSETTPNKKHKSNKQSKNKSKTKKRKKGKKSKKRKSSKGMEESEDLDSGLEDEQDDNEELSEADSDKENETIITVMNNGDRKNTIIQNKAEKSTAKYTKSGISKHVTVLPLVESGNNTQKVETPPISNRTVSDIKIQSASKNSGIIDGSVTDPDKHITGAGISTESIVKNNPNELEPEERSDSRI